MKRKDLERHLRNHGCVKHHHGGRHDAWLNPENLKKAPVPRHRDVKIGTAIGVCRILGIPKPPSVQ